VGLPNPTSAAETNHEASTLICSHVLAAFPGVEALPSAKHKSVIKDVKTELKLSDRAKHESERNLMLTSKLSCDVHRTTLQGQETGHWLLMLPAANSERRRTFCCWCHHPQ
jgi:hypothetical protein